MPLHTTKFNISWLEKSHSDNNPVKLWLKPGTNTSRRSWHRSFQVLVFLDYQIRFFCHSSYTRFLPEKTDLDFLARLM